MTSHQNSLLLNYDNDKNIFYFQVENLKLTGMFVIYMKVEA